MLLLSLLAGCFEPEAPPRPPEVVGTSVDGDGPIAVTDILAVSLSGPGDPGSLDAIGLTRGEADGALVAALGKPPLPARLLPELVAVAVEARGAEVRLTPKRALDPKARYTLVVGSALRAGGARLGRAVLRAFFTGSLEDAAPILRLVDPPDGAEGVVRNLRAIRVSWSKPMPAVDFEVVAANGSIVPSTSRDDQIALGAVLDGSTRFQVRAPASLVDAEGRPPFGDPPGFSTGEELRSQPPGIVGLTLEAADRCLVARFATDRPSVAELCVADRCARDDAGSVHALGAPLAELEDGWRLSARDESTAPPATDEGVVKLPPLPLVLTEVLVEPLGPRWSQQFVELVNIGDGDVPLGGLALSTPSGFDLLPPATLPSGAYAVIVPNGFVDDGVDVPPARGALVLPVANARLGGDGVALGQPIWVQDGSGTLITRWGGWIVDSVRGQSVSRLPYQCDLPASFRPGTPTPGFD